MNDIEASIDEDPHNIAITKLNIWATLSELGKHEKAAEHAQSAILMIQNEYGDLSKSHTRDGKSMDVVFSTQARGFFNLGVELEYLKYFNESIIAYGEALKLSEMYMPDNSDFWMYIKKSIKSVNSK